MLALGHLILVTILFLLLLRVHADVILVLEHIPAVLRYRLEGVAAVLDVVSQVAPDCDRALARGEGDQGRKCEEVENP